jgi:fucose permease
LRIVTGITLGSILLYSFANSMMSVMINEVVNGFSLSGVSEGMMGSMFGIGSMLAVLVAPLIQGRVAKMTVLLFATALQALTLALCGLSPVFALFCVSCAIMGVGGGLVDTYANSLLVDLHKEESTRYLGYLHGLFGVGSLLAPLLVMLVLGLVGWRGVFFALAVIFFAGVAILRMLGRQARHSEMERATREKVLGWCDLREYVLNPRNIIILVACIFSTITQTGVLIWILRYMALRFNAEALGTLSISLFWICATINRFSVSRLRLTPIRLLVAGAVLAALCLSIGVLSDSAWGMCAAMGGFGLCTGHFMQVLFGEGARGYEGKTTFVTSVLIVVMGVARSVTPLMMAFISASFSAGISMLVPAVAAVGVAVSGALLARSNFVFQREDPRPD